MKSDLSPYFLALGANFAFAWASVVFAHFSKTVSPLWTNAFKAIIALIGFSITYVIIGVPGLPPSISLFSFLLSGFLGLCIGDWFLLKAFKELGASRALMLYGFQPIILGVSSFFLFQQKVEPHRFFAIFFLIACLFVFSFENLKKTGSWQVKGILIGLIAISLDACGVILVRYGFEMSPNLSALEVNFYRCVAAVFGFIALAQVRPIHLVDNFKKFKTKTKVAIIAASFSGTFLSLMLYLSAVQTGHLATISSISITSPLFAEITECIVEKRLPSKFLILAFILFASGFLILTI